MVTYLSVPLNLKTQATAGLILKARLSRQAVQALLWVVLPAGITGIIQKTGLMFDAGHL